MTIATRGQGVGIDPPDSQQSTQVHSSDIIFIAFNHFRNDRIFLVFCCVTIHILYLCNFLILMYKLLYHTSTVQEVRTI